VRVDRSTQGEIDVIAGFPDVSTSGSDAVILRPKITNGRSDDSLMLIAGFRIDIESVDIELTRGECGERNEESLGSLVLETGSVPLDLIEEHVVRLVWIVASVNCPTDGEGVGRKEGHQCAGVAVTDDFGVSFAGDVVSKLDRSHKARIVSDEVAAIGVGAELVTDSVGIGDAITISTADGAGDTCGIPSHEGDGVAAGIVGESRIRTAVWSAVASEALLDGLDGVRVVDADHGAGVGRVGRVAVTAEIAVGVIDVGDHAGVDLHAFLNEGFPGDQSAVGHLVGEDVSEASTAAASAAVAESESTLTSGEAVGGSILEELPEGHPVGRQIDEEVSREDDRLIGQDDRARGPRVVGVVEEQGLDFTVDRRGANLRLK